MEVSQWRSLRHRQLVEVGQSGGVGELSGARKSSQRISSGALLPSTSEEGEPSARCRDDQPAVPRLRQRDGASTFDPEHQQCPSPIPC